MSFSATSGSGTAAGGLDPDLDSAVYKDLNQPAHLLTPSPSPPSEPTPSPSSPLVAAENTARKLGSHSTGHAHAHAVMGDDFAAEKGRRRSSEANKPMRLSSQQIDELVGSPESTPMRSLDDPLSLCQKSDEECCEVLETRRPSASAHSEAVAHARLSSISRRASRLCSNSSQASMSAAPVSRQPSTSQSNAAKKRPSLPPIAIEDTRGILHADSLHAARRPSADQQHPPSPMPAVLPLPPRSLPTYLHLELSVDRPSALYIQPSMASASPYESAAIKFERLRNFLSLPLHLERILDFGALACLDAWLYTFTILPLRSLRALAILFRSLAHNASQEALDVAHLVNSGIGRLWRRQQHPSLRSQAPLPASVSHRSSTTGDAAPHQATPVNTPEISASLDASEVSESSQKQRQRPTNNESRRQRTRSTPSIFLPSHKADLLQGLLIVASCAVLMSLDASRMYHSIRGQAAIKLYVIYNVLEVFDRLLSALGQDILECLFSKETLEQDGHGHGRIIRPVWMFFLALAYVISHSTALFYQVVTLNVAVNSYSNALLTLLMSNQFVEIKGTVFKKFEKENLFQLTCADVVERFQLWLMLLIIALRNIVEVGGLTISLGSSLGGDANMATAQPGTNDTGIPLVSMSGFAIPKAFTLMPKWTGELLGPFLIVLGSEALVDWCKHAYITKFNSIKPNIYDRFLDVLAKDYYSHAFTDQNLTKRLGLPIIPLSCLFMRAVMQTYHMFLAAHMTVAIPSTATAISLNSESPSTPSTIMSALHRVDEALRDALGRSSFGAGTDPMPSLSWWSLDDCIALAAMVIFFLVAYLVLLALKLALGMALLTYARNRYKNMKLREQQNVDTYGRRLGGWGTVEVSEDKRRWIYSDDAEGLKTLREKELKNNKRADKTDMKLDSVDRYSMVAKRIW